jgi:hypothetical protein
MTLEVLAIARPIKPSPKLLVSTSPQDALLGFKRTYPSQAWRGLSVCHVIWNGISSTGAKMEGKEDARWLLM